MLKKTLFSYLMAATQFVFVIYGTYNKIILLI